MASWVRGRRGWSTAAAICGLLVLGTAGSASADLIATLGGVDVQSQYTGFNPVVADSGVFTFDDTVNGTNPSPEPGTVTTESGVAGLVGGRIDLEMMLETGVGVYDPATDGVISATFVGTGGAPEIRIWDSTLSTVLLAFDLDFINVTTFSPEVPFLGLDSIITLGSPLESELGSSSRLTVAGGSLAGAVGGVGTEAVLQLTLSDPDPGVTGSGTGYFDDSFVVGIPGTPPSVGVNWEIAIVPEPTTTVLLGGAFVALAALARRKSRSL